MILTRCARRVQVCCGGRCSSGDRNNVQQGGDPTNKVSAKNNNAAASATQFLLWFISAPLLGVFVLIFYVDLFSLTSVNAISRVCAVGVYVVLCSSMYNLMIRELSSGALLAMSMILFSYGIIVAIVANGGPHDPGTYTPMNVLISKPDLGTCIYYDHIDQCPMLGSFMGAPPSSLTCAPPHENFWQDTIATTTVEQIQSTLRGALNLMSRLKDAVGLFPQLLGVSLEEVAQVNLDDCTTALMAQMCHAWFPACNAQCVAMPQCTDICYDTREKCGFLARADVVKKLLAANPREPGRDFLQSAIDDFSIGLPSLDAVLSSLVTCGWGHNTSRSMCTSDVANSTNDDIMINAHGRAYRRVTEGTIYIPICDRAVVDEAGGQALATVMCRELGLGNARYIIPNFIPQSGTQTPRWSGNGITPVCTGNEASLAECQGWTIDNGNIGLCATGDEIGVECDGSQPAPLFGTSPYCWDNIHYPGIQPSVDPNATITDSSLNCDQSYYRRYVSGEANVTLLAIERMNYNAHMSIVDTRDRWRYSDIIISSLYIIAITCTLIADGVQQYQWPILTTAVNRCIRILNGQYNPNQIKPLPYHNHAPKPLPMKHTTTALAVMSSAKAARPTTTTTDAAGAAAETGGSALPSGLAPVSLAPLRNNVNTDPNDTTTGYVDDHGIIRNGQGVDMEDGSGVDGGLEQGLSAQSNPTLNKDGQQVQPQNDNGSSSGKAPVHDENQLVPGLSWRHIFTKRIFSLVITQLVIGGTCFYVGRTVRGSPGWSVAFQLVALYAFWSAFRICWWRSRLLHRLREENIRLIVRRSPNPMIRAWKWYASLFGLGAPYVHERKYFTVAVKAAVQFYSVMSIARTTDSYDLLIYIIALSAHLIITPLLLFPSLPLIRNELATLFDACTDMFFIFFNIFVGDSARKSSMDFSQALAILWPTINFELRLSSLAMFYLWGQYCDYVTSSAHQYASLALSSPTQQQQAASSQQPADLIISPSSRAQAWSSSSPTGAAASAGATPTSVGGGSNLDANNNNTNNENHTNTNNTTRPPPATSPQMTYGVITKKPTPSAPRIYTRTIMAHAVIHQRVVLQWQRWTEAVICLGLLILGIAFAAFGISSIYNQQKVCEDEVGQVVWLQSSPRIYFAGGFFGSRGCSYELVETLSLEHRDLTSVPLSLQRFTQLKSLNLQGNTFDTLPTELSSIVGLQSLDISDNPKFVRFPSLLALSWSQLQYLDMTNTPWERHFDWSNEGLTDVAFTSPILSRALSLLMKPLLVESIDLSDNALANLPAFTYASILPQLTVLDLRHNNLAELSDAIGMVKLWPAMSYMLCGSNQLTSWPSSVEPSKWLNLTQLDLSSNQLGPWLRIPMLARLPQHIVLNLTGNRQFINALDFEIQGLTDIHHSIFDLDILKVDLDRNYITYISPRINQWHHLQELSIGQMSTISSLPDDLSNMTDMIIFKLYEVPFTNLSWSMHTWVNLTTLDIRNTSFTELPTVVWYLWGNHALRTVSIYGTPLSEDVTLLNEMKQQRGMRCDYTDQTYGDGLMVCGIDCDVTINGVKIGWGNVTLNLTDPSSSSTPPIGYYASSGTMSVGRNHAGMYNDARVCEWTLLPPLGYRVELNFTQFATEGSVGTRCKDPLVIWDGPQRNPFTLMTPPLLGTNGWCGVLNDTDKNWHSSPLLQKDGYFKASSAFHFLWAPDTSINFAGWDFDYRIRPI